jgi:hypothetical protein
MPTCNAHIGVFNAANRADAAPSDAFGKALAEGEAPLPTSNRSSPKNTSATHTSDSAAFQKMGKAAAAMANAKRSNKSNGNNTSGTKSVSKSSSSLGSALLSELMAAKVVKKPKK